MDFFYATIIIFFHLVSNIKLMHPTWFFSCIILHTFILVLLAATTCPKSGKILTSPSEFITDGPGAYTPNMDCSWIIAPTGCSAVSISFSSTWSRCGHQIIMLRQVLFLPGSDCNPYRQQHSDQYNYGSVC